MEKCLPRGNKSRASGLLETPFWGERTVCPLPGVSCSGLARRCIVMWCRAFRRRQAPRSTENPLTTGKFNYLN